MRKFWYVSVCALAFLICVCFLFNLLRNPLTLRKVNTEEANGLKQELLDAYADSVKIRYRAFNHIQIDCTNEAWDPEELTAIADLVTDRASQEAFQKSFSEVYEKRCNTQDGLPKTLMLYLFQTGEDVPDYTFSSVYPFTEWSKVDG